MAAKSYPVYKTEEWIAKTDYGFRFAMVENRDFSAVEHSHDFYEITTVFCGSMQHRINSRDYTQKKGDICILRPGDRHLQTRQGEIIKAGVYSISAAVIEPFLAVFDAKNRLYANRNGVIFHVHSQQLQSLQQAYAQHQCQSGQQKLDQGRIIISMLLQYYLQFENGEQVDWIDRITREMNTPENLAEGVPALQRIANLSHPQLCRVFRRTINKTPQEFIRELRLNYAYAMVCNTDESFEKISAMVGYASFSHFSNIFKEHFQQSPSALRKTTIKYW